MVKRPRLSLSLLVATTATAVAAALFAAAAKPDAEAKAAAAKHRFDPVIKDIEGWTVYRNDFYPFVKAELKQHDPVLYDLLVEIWGPLE